MRLLVSLRQAKTIIVSVTDILCPWITQCESGAFLFFSLYSKMLHMNISPLSNLQEWLDKAINYERLPHKVEFSLDSMREIASKFGNPQNNFKSVHIAGSKGKGSVSQFIAAILHEAGYSEGVYTSPHISDFSERVRTAQGIFNEAIYKKSACELQARTDTQSATWFELVTLFSFLCFKNAGVEWGIFETGIGGRLDATNIILPQLCVITPIELEHTEILGDTIEKIAAEKAGIFKKGVPVCVAPQKKEVRAVFEQKARERGCPIFFLDDILSSCSYTLYKDVMETKLDFTNKEVQDKSLFKRPLFIRLQMFGGVQAQNAALAALACKILFPDIQESVIERGLASSKLAGRFEIVHHTSKEFPDLTIILDGAHTINSVRHTLDTLKSLKPAVVHLLFGCAADKKIDEIAPLFFDSDLPFTHITLTPPGAVKKADLKAMQNAFEKKAAKVPLTIRENYEAAICEAIKKAAQEKAFLLVTGSFYLVGEVKKYCLTN